MKEGQGKERGFVFHGPFVGTDAVFVKQGPGAPEIGFQIGGGFVHDFDAALQQRFGDGFEMRQRGRFRRQEATEVGVRTIGRLLQRVLEARQPILHQMNVLQKDPAAAFTAGPNNKEQQGKGKTVKK